MPDPELVISEKIIKIVVPAGYSLRKFLSAKKFFSGSLKNRHLFPPRRFWHIPCCSYLFKRVHEKKRSAWSVKGRNKMKGGFNGDSM